MWRMLTMAMMVKRVREKEAEVGVSAGSGLGIWIQCNWPHWEDAHDWQSSYQCWWPSGFNPNSHHHPHRVSGCAECGGSFSYFEENCLSSKGKRHWSLLLYHPNDFAFLNGQKCVYIHTCIYIHPYICIFLNYVLVLIYLGNFYLLTAFIQFPPPHPSPLVAKNLISFSMSIFGFEIWLTSNTC